MTTSIYAAALACPCPTCKAPPGVLCDAPRKQTRWKGLQAARQTWGAPPLGLDASLLHITRQDVGIRHRRREARKAHP